MMPDYAMGFWQSKLRYQTQEEVLHTAQEYKRRGLPLSVIVIDFFHWPYHGDWNFDYDYWPNPEEMTQKLHEMGVKSVSYTHLVFSFIASAAAVPAACPILIQNPIPVSYTHLDVYKRQVLFRGVKIGAGAKLSNCVIMQDTEIGQNCRLNYVVTDKNVIIKNDRSLMGFQSYPVYISKESIV